MTPSPRRTPAHRQRGGAARRSPVPSRNRTIVAALAAGGLFAAACSNDTATLDRPDTGVAPSATPTTAATTTTAPIDAPDGPRTLNDPVLPDQGNGGYDVVHYDVRLDTTAVDTGGPLVATTTIDLDVDEPLRSISLDLVGQEIDGVRVDDTAADHRREGDKLVVEPEVPFTGRHEIVVTHHGVPTPIEDESAPVRIGWLTADTGTYLVAEPGGMRSIIPCNDHPSDPATWTVTVVAPADDVVAASGTLTSGPSPSGSGSEWVYELTSAVPTYAVQIAIGDYEIVTSEVDLGTSTLPVRHVVPRRMPPELRERLSITDEQLRWFVDLLGFHPDETYGILAADAPVILALETSTLSMIPYGWLASDSAESVHEVTSHELAHQWFGNRVTIANWGELWLSEGWATYLSWLWLEHKGLLDLGAQTPDLYRKAARLRRTFGAVRQPTPATLWSENQYTGAAVVLHDLRTRLGDDRFFELARRWVSRDDTAGSDTDQFIALASEIAGDDLSSLLHAWLDTTTVPEPPTN